MQRIRTMPATSALAAVVAATFAAVAASPASADTVDAPLSVQGTFTNFGQNNGAYNAAPGNILVGRQGGPTSSVSFHNYFVFDLTGLSGTVTSASLTLTLPYNTLITPSPSETWTLYDVDDASVPTLHDQYAKSQYAVYGDLGAGQTYGSRAFTSADNHTTISVTLNADALQDIEAHLGGQFAIGGALTTLDASQSEMLFAFTDYGTQTTLQLTLGPAAGAAVPLPGAAVAGLALLAPLPLARRRRRSTLA